MTEDEMVDGIINSMDMSLSKLLPREKTPTGAAARGNP